MILETQHLTKHFGSRKALDDVSLSLREGGVYGLLGPNGAGKTTFLRLVNNILVKDSGEVLYRGKPLDRKSGRHLGYMAEERGLYSKMSVEDQILFFGRLRGGEPKRLRQVMKEYMDIFEMADSERRRKVQELSKGNQQKVQIISTLVHEPDLVMLDEPFSGFDPINGALLNTAIKRLKDNGATIVLSSHNMPAVEEICSSIALINNGKLLLSGPLRQIKNRFRKNTFLVSASAPIEYTQLIKEGIVKSTESQPRSAYEPFTSIVQIDRRDAINEVVDSVCRQATLVEFHEQLPTLSELFIRFANGEEEPINIPETDDNSFSPYQKLN